MAIIQALFLDLLRKFLCRQNNMLSKFAIKIVFSQKRDHRKYRNANDIVSLSEKMIFQISGEYKFA